MVIPAVAVALGACQLSAQTPAEALPASAAAIAAADSVEVMNGGEEAAPVPENLPDLNTISSMSALAKSVAADSKAAASEKPDSTAADFFVNAPVAIFPTLDRNTRLDMVDYFNAGSDKPSKNAMKGDARVLSISPEQIKISTSPVAEYSITLLDAKGYPRGKVLMVSRTISAPAKDTSMKFYTVEWKEIPGMFQVPMLDDWMLKEARKNKDDVQNAVPFVMASMTYAPESKRLTFVNNIGDYIPEEALGLARNSLSQTIVYIWNGKKFVRSE